MGEYRKLPCYVHIVHLGTVWHSLWCVVWWLESIMVSSTQTHPSRQFNFTLTNTLHCALDKSSAQCTWWNWWQILCWANCALDKRQGTWCGYFQYNDGWGLGVGLAQRNNRLFQKANSDMIQFSMRTKMEHWKLDEIAWAWEYPTILTVHWKWELQNQSALKARFAKASSLQNQQHCGKS